MVRGERETTSKPKGSKSFLSSNTLSIPTLVSCFHEFVRFELDRENASTLQPASRSTYGSYYGLPCTLHPLKKLIFPARRCSLHPCCDQLTFPPGGKWLLHRNSKLTVLAKIRCQVQKPQLEVVTLTLNHFWLAKIQRFLILFHSFPSIEYHRLQLLIDAL